MTGHERASLDEAERLVAELAETFVADLVGKVVGVVLHGSLASGEYVPGTSDVDLLVVVASPLSLEEQKWFSERANGVAARWPGRVDLRVVLETVAGAPPRSPCWRLTPRSSRGLPGRFLCSGARPDH